MSDGVRLDVTAYLERFRSGFSSQAIPVRKVGREAEFPVVDADGNAFDITLLWRGLMRPGLRPEYGNNGHQIGLNGPRYSYASEVGKGTIEVITGPRLDLLHLSRDHEEALHRLVTVAAEHGARVLGMGTQPKTPPSQALMTPKPRYGVMLEALGDPWLTFTATASDQTHVDVSGPEIVATMNLCNLLSPIIIALCGNSGVVSGGDADVCSWREHAMGTIQPEYGRHGMPVEPATTLAHHMEMLCALPHLMDRVDGEAFLGDGRPFSTFMRSVEGERSWKAFLVHDHYVWHSARPRHRQGTIEIRCACQQPWQEHMAASALALGLVAGAAEIAGFVQSKLGMDVWQVMRDWHTQVIRHGLAAPEPVDGLMEGVLERAKGALRGRGRQEAALLDPLFRRLERKQNPAQRARALLADQGLDAVIDAASIPSLVE